MTPNTKTDARSDVLVLTKDVLVLLRSILKEQRQHRALLAKLLATQEPTAKLSHSETSSTNKDVQRVPLREQRSRQSLARQTRKRLGIPEKQSNQRRLF